MNISVFALIFFLLFLLPKFVSTVPNSTFFLGFLFSVKLIFIVIWSGALKSSIKDYDSFYDLPFFVLEAQYQSSEASKEEDCNIRRKEDPSPCLALVEYMEEPLSTNKKKEEPLLAPQKKEEKEEEPLVLAEYMKEEEPLVLAEYMKEEEPLVVAEYMQEEPLLLEFYDVDDDEGEEDLRRRFEEEEEQRKFEEEEQRKFEEFIAKHYRKWKEELVTDRLLCITAGASIVGDSCTRFALYIRLCKGGSLVH